MLLFNIKGLLIISSENTFDWTFEIARKIANQMVELEIKDLLTKSEFFRLSLADNKLRPIAENIIQKKSRSEKDKSYLYTLWEFKKDINDLKKEAKKYNVDSSYVDEILKDISLKPVDGTLFFYYKNEIGFMLQWSLMNLSIITILLILTHYKYRNTTLWTLARKTYQSLELNGR
jgi:hypothetical protein